MIAIDTSSWIAYFQGDDGPDVSAVDRVLGDGRACLPPVVLTELLSDPKLPKRVGELIQQLPLLDVKPGYWERAGALRAKLIARRHKARLADSLIAQSCIDAGVSLVTRDSDFRHFVSVGALAVLPGQIGK
jgi:predicted nucleic acid-binding protein